MLLNNTTLVALERVTETLQRSRRVLLPTQTDNCTLQEDSAQKVLSITPPSRAKLLDTWLSRQGGGFQH